MGHHNQSASMKNRRRRWKKRAAKQHFRQEEGRPLEAQPQGWIKKAIVTRRIERRHIIKWG